eukprot:TRINITY_DN3811_c1_g1_i1.p1 TRINITY_DN3811_c1_g1~~TRINITY_DN3811_c1_g1_i1.p1  ORF type:complete len:388 (+),score=109.83 TRINITY_DN3811_c1_g1_i1:138-1166(+)
MASYVCPACGGCVAEGRRAAHENSWCPALPPRQAGADESDAESEGSASEKKSAAAAAAMGGARAELSSLYEAVVRVELGSLPGLAFEFEQEDIFGPLDTGGALWYADRVMAEYLAACAPGAPASPAPLTAAAGADSAGAARDVALVLGCGGAPLSGLVACALGWEVIVTDLGVVLRLIEKNIDRNMPAMQASLPPGRRPLIKSIELPFGDDEALAAALGIADVDSVAGGARLGRLLVLCSDCVWQRPLHDLLLQTYASALRRSPVAGGIEALIAFQARNPEVEASFLALARSERFGFHVEPVDIGETLRRVRWPAQVKGTMLTPGTDLNEHFMMYKLSLATC